MNDFGHTTYDILWHCIDYFNFWDIVSQENLVKKEAIGLEPMALKKKRANKS